MQQHPVPQHISSYEFKLVGDMTLKQFFQLAGGIGIALLFYATALPGFIKWPFILFFSLLGTALAFLPFEERPLSTWIFAFFKAAYSPTRYVWAKGQTEEVFPKETGPDSIGAGPQIPPITTTPQVTQTEPVPEFEQKEASFVQKVTEMFQASTPAGQIPQTQTIPQLSPQRVVLKVEEAQNRIEPSIPYIQPTRPPVLQTLVNPVFTPQTSPPAPPQTPNTIAGQVLTAEDKIIDGAILEVRDINNLPVRALKSNKAGHFLTVTPLPDGEYVITTDKEGFDFSPVKFVANGSIIPPILVRAK